MKTDSTLIFRYFLRYFSSTHRTDLSRFRGTFHSFGSCWLCYFRYFNSKRTGRPVFLWPRVARASEYPLGATSSTLIATTSQPRSLLSMARLNIANSRARLSIRRFVRMDQTRLANSGGFAPISFPLFHGVRVGGGRIEFSSSMVILLELSEDGMVRRMPDPWRTHHKYSI